MSDARVEPSATDEIDVWEVEPHLQSDFDCAVFDNHIEAARHAAAVAEQLIDGMERGGEQTITIRMKSMSRREYRAIL